MSCSTWVKSTSSAGSCVVHLGANLADDVVDAAAALVLQLDRNVARVRLGHGGQSQLQAGAPRRALHFGTAANDLLDMGDHSIGFLQRTARRHHVIENEAALIHRRKQVAAQCL